MFGNSGIYISLQKHKKIIYKIVKKIPLDDSEQKIVDKIIEEKSK